MRPLDGVTVVSLEQAVAAPFATRQLADLGARVIKVERAEGDFARRYDAAVHGESSYFVWLNRNKESIVLDLKAAEGIEALQKLIGLADVLVQNLAPGALERLGIKTGELLATHPELIVISISGYGMGGPFSNKKAYDALIQGEAGLIDLTGTPNDRAKVGVSIADIAAGMYAYSGALTALIQRQTTGQGALIEVSMLEALSEWTAQPELYARYGGTQQPRAGASHPTIVPYGEFETADGPVFFSVQNEREWASFCNTVLAQPDRENDPLFASNTTRAQNRTLLYEIINQALRKIGREEAIARLDAAGVANAGVRSMAELANHPQLRARDRWRPVVTANGIAEVLIPPVTMGTEPRLDPVPALGEHTASILSEIGMNSEKMECPSADS